MSGAFSKPHLNIDVLLVIISYADRPTQSRMMKTCRVLYREGARALLKEDRVMLRNEAQLISFLRFMRVDPSVRFRTLSKLGIDLEERASYRAGRGLKVFFLELAASEHTSLRHLSLSKVEELLLANPNLAGAIARLTSLTDISLFDVGTQGSILLRNLRSCLTDAEIGFDRDSMGSRDVNPSNFDLIRLLKQSKDTLKVLSVTNHEFATPHLTHVDVYPLLTSLSLSGRWIPFLPNLHRAFPNLTTIAIDEGYPVVTADAYEQWREGNQSYQHARGSWGPMKSFYGSLLDLYVLGPICRVEQVHFDDWQNTADATMLHSVLADARPTHLMLGEWLGSEAFLDEEWLGALAERRTPQLRVLEVLLKVKYDDDGDIGRALDNLCATVASLSLEGFSLTIDAVRRERDNEELESFLRDLDMGALAQRIKNSTASTKAVWIRLEDDTGEVRLRREGTSGLSSDLAELLGYPALRWL